jgi:hypothetical protein
MIEKFVIVLGSVSSEFLDLNHASKSMFLVFLMIPKFAPDPRPRALTNFGIGTLESGAALFSGARLNEAGAHERRIDNALGRLGDRHERQSDLGFAQPKARGGIFHRPGIGLAEHRIV